LIVDNLLWHGQVLDPNDHDHATQGVRELTHLLTSDAGWISSLIPIRDGVLIAYRK
jgi:predicted O-methyltransferase YrrM